MSRVGERIREERTKSGISAKELAKKLGLAESFVNDVEQGRKIVNENIINKIEKLFNTSLSEISFNEVSEPIENIKEAVVNKNMNKTVNKEVSKEVSKEINKQWEDAFSNILKKIPVCDINLKEINGYKYLPVIDKKIEGYSADKIMFVKVEDDSMRGFRLQKDDTVMIYQNTELSNNSLLLLRGENKNVIRQVKRLDANKALIISHSNELKTETRDIKSLNILGRCVKVEIEL
jgi:transcriptional regulator with XRE-family HTH domain